MPPQPSTGRHSRYFCPSTVSHRASTICLSLRLPARPPVSPGVWGAGEFGAGVPQGGGLVRRWGQTTGATHTTHQQTHGAEGGVPEGWETERSTGRSDLPVQVP